MNIFIISPSTLQLLTIMVFARVRRHEVPPNELSLESGALLDEFIHVQSTVQILMHTEVPDAANF